MCVCVQHPTTEYGDLSETSKYQGEVTMLSDSEMSYNGGSVKQCTKRMPRRRLLSSEEYSDMLDDEEDVDIDDEQFLLERQKSRRERIMLQKKMGKKRMRKASVGTSTEEDGIIIGEVINAFKG
jgi:hypothetical protein